MDLQDGSADKCACCTGLDNWVQLLETMQMWKERKQTSQSLHRHIVAHVPTHGPTYMYTIINKILKRLVRTHTDYSLRQSETLFCTQDK